MRHENRYFFAHLFGFAGLTVDETIHSIGGWLRGFQMPYLMPHVWRAMLALAFAVGGVIFSRFLSSSLDIFKNV